MCYGDFIVEQVSNFNTIKLLERSLDTNSTPIIIPLFKWKFIRWKSLINLLKIEKLFENKEKQDIEELFYYNYSFLLPDFFQG